MSITNPYPNPPTNIMNRGLVGSPVKSVGIQDFSPGWEKLIKSEEKKINNYLTYAKLGSIEGNLIKSSLYNNPTGGAWNASTISIMGIPIVSSENTFATDIINIDLINNQTLFRDIANPPPLNDYLFLQGNSNSVQNLSNNITLNLGVTDYQNIELSFLDNCVRDGDSNGEVTVYNFPLTPSITGNQTLKLIFNEYVGELLLGIRLESTTNQSSIFKLRTFILQN